ncbi:glycosyltransferase [Spirosoma sp. BT702]|uniref:Glycosyltransferase n=1 Tax=Spirosoma profusum TaxID=2771354 RepID=A0A927AUU1_9BACT|nr:glycosyltransferase [Spirosoma profusum]MBD2704806.1 glycosyltransferase [Spirosoma profusum]
MITTLLIAWLLVVSIQLIYILFIYSRTAFYRQPEIIVSGNENGTLAAGATLGVTIVVCARNELENLKELLPLLDAQEYPNFDVLVMDDRSSDGTQQYLDSVVTQFRYVRHMRIEKEHEHITPKKYALTIALKKTANPVVLLTDADCRPETNCWLAGMIAPLARAEKAITLGFSPYYYQPGFLNLLIRSETLFTAVQYFSLALASRPYMGVGRNLSYRTNLFFENKGFYSHINVTGGDDDLFINEVATGRNTAICLHPDTFVWSAPKTTWSEWRQQKHRHLHVGRYYKPGNKIRLAFLVGSHLLSWIFALAVGGVVLYHELEAVAFSPNEWLLLQLGTGVFVFRLLTFWGVVGRISYRLAHTVHWTFMPFMDVILAMYYGLASLKTLVIRPKKRIYWR